MNLHAKIACHVIVADSAKWNWTTTPMRRPLWGDKLLDINLRFSYKSKSRSSKGRGLETHLDAERVRFLRAGFVTPLPGGPGIDPAGTKNGARGASL